MYTEIKEGAPLPENLADRLMAGGVFVARRCLQTLGIFDEITATSLEHIRGVCGDDTAKSVSREGFEAIHRFASLEQIEAIMDHIYQDLAKKRAAVDCADSPAFTGHYKTLLF